MLEIWFWQTVVTPHMTALAVACAEAGHRVTYVTQELMTADRIQQGWPVTKMPGVALRVASSADAMQQAADDAPVGAVHICQGLRGNGLVSAAQKRLRQRHAAQWVVMETVEDSGWRGAIKRMLYHVLFMRRRAYLQGVLATGWRTPAWVQARGVPAAKVFPFAYFLPDVAPAVEVVASAVNPPFRVLFVGQLIELKRLGLLLEVLAAVSKNDVPAFSLQVIGAGPLEAELRAMDQRLLGARMEWMGTLPMDEVRRRMAAADVLVLPSRYDGWGAVVSEALMAGTPVICSDTCGAAGVVRVSGAGGVFPSESQAALEALLAQAIAAGCQLAPAREKLANWANCLGAQAGASYLTNILEYSAGRGARPLPPWQDEIIGTRGTVSCVA